MVLLEIIRSNCLLTVTRYTLYSDKLTAPVRLVELVDLHSREFGVGNRWLIARVKRQEPDLILMPGDMLNGKEPYSPVAEELIAALTEIAPVYASYGNHEKTHENRYWTYVRTEFSEAGATVLDLEYEDLLVNGQRMRIGGIFGFCLPERHLVSGEAKRWEVDFLKRFQETDAYTVLLAHLPTCWIQNENLDFWQIDCILSGHEHGGQIRLPFVGALYAPDRGLFPDRAEGLYHSEDGKRTLVLSRGLGSAVAVPRIFNMPEIVVVDIVPEEQTGET